MYKNILMQLTNHLSTIKKKMKTHKGMQMGNKLEKETKDFFKMEDFVKQIEILKDLKPHFIGIDNFKLEISVDRHIVKFYSQSAFYFYAGLLTSYYKDFGGYELQEILTEIQDYITDNEINNIKKELNNESLDNIDGEIKEEEIKSDGVEDGKNE